MRKRLSAQAMSRALTNALSEGAVQAEDSSVLFYDLSLIAERTKELAEQFPKDTLHAVAVKANPLRKVLAWLHALGEQDNAPQLGLESASEPEMHLALGAGFDPSHVVFDSPAKTLHELRFAITQGVHLNMDNMQEVERVDTILKDLGHEAKSTFGIRVNPQVGQGSIGATSVAAEYSKFGVPLKTFRKELLEIYRSHPWMTGIHVHVGSQGCPLDQLVLGVRSILDFVEEVNAATDGQIRIFDLGGGLPADYGQKEFQAPSFTEYVAALRTGCPELFSGKFRLMTEFGRAVHANAGFAASRVEYIKPQGDIRTAVIHLGADMFLRKCYNPGDWHHEFSVCDKNGALKDGPTRLYRIAGPLCFAGDLPGRDIALPEIEPGDWILIHDTGAYTLSMWSRYNSRAIPSVLGYKDEQASTGFVSLKRREQPQDVLSFWE
ncbi:diaminopimelate decarboxylase [Desulfobaculum bizertense]|uniref:diaminopimelate decarboxylase n=1 Tax=Desulfobaculum bizertense TaxID=376490 RepID=UPI001F2F0160|nr:diaminopimelate decarboxylase [Desulfobaculum bizertense]UIJ37197.1 diaminopimelate decarboxylase [Desulfobaculum bizertense]